MSQCQRCFHDYDEHEHKPQQLNPCGHCACLSCTQELTGEGAPRMPKCPWCRVQVHSIVENRGLILVPQENSPRDQIAPPPRLPLTEERARRQVEMFLENHCSRFAEGTGASGTDFPVFATEIQKEFADLVDQLWTEHCCFDIPVLGRDPQDPSKPHPADVALLAVEANQGTPEVLAAVQADPTLKYLRTLFGLIDNQKREDTEAFVRLMRSTHASLAFQEFRVHVLWDTENIRLADTGEFLTALEQLFTFLEKQGIGSRYRFRLCA
eukprot:RCo052753